MKTLFIQFIAWIKQLLKCKKKNPGLPYTPFVRQANYLLGAWKSTSTPTIVINFKEFVFSGNTTTAQMFEGSYQVTNNVIVWKQVTSTVPQLLELFSNRCTYSIVRDKLYMTYKTTTFSFTRIKVQ